MVMDHQRVEEGAAVGKISVFQCFNPDPAPCARRTPDVTLPTREGLARESHRLEPAADRHGKPFLDKRRTLPKAREALGSNDPSRIGMVVALDLALDR
jgi:hypothetical protein